MRQLRLIGYFLFVLFVGLSTSVTFYLLLANPVNAVRDAQCANGFSRPLLFGINPADRDDADQTIPDTGGTMTSVTFAWDRIEPAQAQMDYSGPESFISKYDAAKLVIIGSLSGTPKWAAQRPEFWDNEPYTGWAAGKSLPKKDQSEAAFRSFVRTTVNRYKGSIKYWTYGNEPNGCGSNNREGCDSSEGGAKDYTYWMNIAFEEVKKEDPNAIFIGGQLEWLKDQTQFIRWMDQYGAKYDGLAIHPYEKETANDLNFSKIEAAYTAQSNKKPIWITEWGWDLKWPGFDKENNSSTVRQTMAASLVENALNKMKSDQYSYIAGAMYLAIRDTGGGEYGLRQNKDGVEGLRVHGQKFKEIATATCPLGAAPPPPPPAPSCVTATQNIYNLPLRANQEVTVTSTANTNIGKFIYKVYNLDNLKDGIPLPYCVTGATTKADGCPDGTGHLTAEGTQNGLVQSLSIYNLPNNQLGYGLWRGNQGWTKLSLSASWDVPFPATSLPGTGEVHALDTIPAKEVAQISYWKGGKGYVLTAPYNQDKSGINASGITPQEVADLKKQPDVFPGTGQIVAQSSIISGGNFYQFIWRQDGREFTRTLPVKPADGLPDYNNTDQPATFTATGRRLDLMPGSGYLEATDLYLATDSSDAAIVKEIYWRNNQGFESSIPITNGKPDFDKRSDYTGPVTLAQRLPNTTSAKTGSYSFTYEELSKPDMNTSWTEKQGANGPKVPQNLQINATFVTKDGKYIGNDVACVTKVKVDRLPGDFDGNCTVNLLDFNQFKTQYKSFKCNVNLLGSDCYIDLLDFNQFKEQYNKSCTK